MTDRARKGDGEGEAGRTAEHTTAAPDLLERDGHRVATLGRHLRLDDLERLAERRDLVWAPAAVSTKVPPSFDSGAPPNPGKRTSNICGVW